MNDRNSFLREKLSGFLQRLNPPRAMQSNEQAQKDEILDLYNRIVKLAPSKGYSDWWKDFTEHLLSNAIARTWPTLKEMNEAAKAIAPKRPDFVDLTGDDKFTLDANAINAKRIKAHEPVSDFYVTGKGAKDLVRLGLITDDDLNPYREYLAHHTVKRN